MSKSTKGGNVILRDVRVPDQVSPGETFEVEAEVANGALAINPWDPDACTDDSLDDAAYELVVDFNGPNGETRQDGPFCLAITELGTKDTIKTATFTAPSTSGTETIGANVRLPGSGKETGEVSDTLVVSGSDAETPEDTDDGDGGGVDWGGDDDGNGDGGDGPQLPSFGPDGTGLKVAAGFVGVLLLLWLLAPYAQLGASLSGGGE